MSRCSVSVTWVSFDWLLLPLREGIERNNKSLQAGDDANLQAGRLRRGRLSRRPTCQQLSRNAAASSVITGTFQARPSLKQTAVEFQALESFCARVRLPLQSTPEDDAINKGSCVSDPPSP